MARKTEITELFFPETLYAAGSVELAAYVFEGRASIKLSSSPGGVRAEVSPAFAAGDFANEALNQQCRLDLSAVNGKLAGMIVTRALLSASGRG